MAEGTIEGIVLKDRRSNCAAQRCPPVDRGDRARLLAHPGARSGRALPAHPALVAADDVQHRGRGSVHRRPGRSPRSRGALAPRRRRIRVRRPRRNRSRTCPTTGRASSWLAWEASRRALAPLTTACGSGRPSPLACATSPARCPPGVYRAGHQSLEAGHVRAGPRPGSTSSGPISTPIGTTRRPLRRSTSWPRSPRSCGCLGPTLGRQPNPKRPFRTAARCHLSPGASSARRVTLKIARTVRNCP